jgi:hypothetical protein
MFLIRIAAYEVIVEIESDAVYPDAMTDIVNRANESFARAINSLTAAGVPFDPATLIDDDMD